MIGTAARRACPVESASSALLKWIMDVSSCTYTHLCDTHTKGFAGFVDLTKAGFMYYHTYGV
jgi:hypothetical protein